jgi:hypothetical protein
VLDTQVVQFRQRSLGLVLLVKPALHHLVTVVQFPARGRVDNLLLSGFVHRKQPHQVLEQLLLLGCFRGPQPTELALGLLVPAEQQAHNVLVLRRRQSGHLHLGVVLLGVG